MIVVIPLGGVGKRFSDLGYKDPKPLIKVLGKEIIFWVVDNLKLKKKDKLYIVYNNQLEKFNFEKEINSSLVIKEPVGVCGLITPWNWPLNQISCKVAPALAAGCTMVLKPSEIAPLSAIVFSDILNEAGLPDGVINFLPFLLYLLCV